jgi:serine/threonine protein phosphatase PrpC
MPDDASMNPAAHISDLTQQLIQLLFSTPNMLSINAAPKVVANEIIDADLLLQLSHDHKVFNAIFDVAEVIFERYAYQLAALPDQYLQQSTLLHILKQGRFAPNLDMLIQHDQRGTEVPLMTVEEQPALNAPELKEDNQHDALIGNVLDDALSCDPARDDNAQQDVLSDATLPDSASEAPLESPDNRNDPNSTSTPADISPADQVIKKMTHFQIPNARVGQPYQAQMQQQGAQRDEPVVLDVDSVQMPETLGIAYDAAQQSFVGTPIQAGDFKIVFRYKHTDGAWRDGYCTLIINADPRSLWQVREPADGQAYPKAHTDHQLIETDQFKLVAASRRGRSHEHAGSFRDDDFFIGNVESNIESGAWSVMIVADGAGSAPFSREGSRVAVETTGELLAEYLTSNHQQLDQYLSQWQIGAQDEQTKAAAQSLSNCFHDLFYKAAQQSIQRIEQLAQEQAVASKSFATTLLVAVVKQHADKTFVSTFWIGDGAITVYSPHKMRLMGMPDSGEFAGQTRFLDRSIAATFNDRVNIGYFADAQAVILMTDGISDPKFETDAGLQNQQKWDDLWQAMQPSLQQPQPDVALLDWIHFFSAGHHDDRTIAILCKNTQAAIDNAVLSVSPEATLSTDQGAP